MTAAYPLAWPPALERTSASKREAGAFKATLTAALGNVETSLNRFGNDSGIPVRNIVLSSNVSLGVNDPPDPGVAVWFLWDGQQHCIAVDRYKKPAANLQAIHHVLEARRTELRHGTLAMVRATFSGLRALPAPASSRPWHRVLGLQPNATQAAIEEAYRILAAQCHPDRGGSQDAMAELNRARAEARQERS